jgi:hypothetical protein
MQITNIFKEFSHKSEKVRINSNKIYLISGLYQSFKLKKIFLAT